MTITLSDMAFLLKGLILGFSIAAPVGPIGVLCIRRTLEGGMASGFVSGLGAAAADGLYGTVAAFGIASVTGFLISGSQWLRLAGGAFLIWLGITTLLKKPVPPEAGVPLQPLKRSLAGDFVTTFFLTLTNPMTIIFFTAVFAGVGLGSAGSGSLPAVLLVMGVFSGSAAWWLGLSLFLSLFRHKAGPGVMKWVNRLSGAVIAVFGLAALWSTTGL